MKISIAIATALVLALAVSASAGNNPDAKVAVHVKSHNPKQNCGALPPIASAEDISTTYEGSSFDAFPVFFDLTEYKGVGYGMCWPDWTYSAGWTQCADLVIGSITWPGDGVYQTWTECHAEAILITGWVWLYADGPGQISVCNHPDTDVMEVLDCSEGLDNVVGSYAAGVFGAEGDDASDPTMVERTTWGAIKGMFE